MSDTLKLANSIWPNGMQVDSDGSAVFYELGTNKVDIPTSSAAWPKGNKLISPFVYQDDKLVGFCDTKAMEVGDATIIVMPYEHIEADFSSIDKGTIQIATPKAITKKASWKDGAMDVIPEAQYKYKGCKTVDNVKAVDSNYKTTDIVDGTWTELLCDLESGNSMFYECSNLTNFTSDLSSITNGNSMFYNCSNLTTFNSDLSSLTNGYGMFRKCSNLTTFDSDLGSLTHGQYMFYSCKNITTFTYNLSSLYTGYSMFSVCRNLTTFTSDLSSLEDGNEMFYGCWSLASFTSDLSSLTSGPGMFYECSGLTTFTSDLSSLTNGGNMFYNCTALTTFTSDLSSLTYGYYTFYGCTALTTFTPNLSSLTNGYYMFFNCKLNTESLIHIAETIKNVKDLTNGNNNGATIYKTIHIGIGNTTPTEEETELLAEIYNKGWKVYVNGSSSSNLFRPAALIPIDGEETATPIPFWAKPQETDEEHAEYIGEDGKYYIILGGQFIFVDDPETYGMFTSLEDAAANMRLTPYTKPQTETTND